MHDHTSILMTGLVLLLTVADARGQAEILVEDFEFALDDGAAAAGVLDLTDSANSPAFYISGFGETASQGEWSIGTDAVFCQLDCIAGSVIGFRRYIDPLKFPSSCPVENHFAPLQLTYGDPDHVGEVTPDAPLSDLTVVCDIYGDGAFADGPTGTHFIVKLVDCEGEVFEFVNHTEHGLFWAFWTLNVVMGRTAARLSPASLSDVPDGDRLLTEIAAIEVFIQDGDDPPTTLGKWYIDNLRIVEPGGVASGATASRYLAITPAPNDVPVAVLVSGYLGNPGVACFTGYVQAEGDLAPTPVFQMSDVWGTINVSAAEILPSTSYMIQIDSGTPGTPILSTPVVVTTAPFGEVDGAPGVDSDDIACTLAAFQGNFEECSLWATDVGGCTPNATVDLDDILFVINAFDGQPFSCPVPCP